MARAGSDWRHRLYRSETAGNVPLPADLERGELAINLVDRRLYTKDQADAVKEIARDIEIGTDAQRLAYTGEATQYYTTDFEQWWDLIANTWTKRAGTGYVPPAASTVTNAQFTAIFAALDTQKISDGTFSDTDVAAFNAAVAAAGL